MFFSVIIPCFNSASKIRRTLQSCLDQTFSDFEVVAVNDGSTDDTSKILEEYKIIFLEKGLVFQVVHTHNGGPAFSRNQGWAVARGNHIAFLDHDDVWHAQKLEIVHAVLNEHSEIDCLGHAFKIGSPELQQVYPKYELLDINSLIKRMSTINFLLRNFIVTPSLVLRRKIRERFDEKMHYCEDHDFLLRTVQKHRVFYLNLPLVFIDRPVLSKGGQSSNRWNMRKGELRLYTKFCQCNIFLGWMLPVLVVFSLAKHLKTLCIRKSSLS